MPGVQRSIAACRVWGVTILAALLCTACGFSVSRPLQNPPFSVKTAEQRVTPDNTVDPIPAATNIYGALHVLDASGHKVELDARRTPILFVAYWCPHCQRTLQLLVQNRDRLARLPVVVSMGFVPGTSVEQAVSLTRQEEQALHLAGLTIYYAVDPSSRAWVPNGYPTLVYAADGQLRMLYGEHTLSVWQQVLSSG
ncbi:MAG: hypothetical protein IRZ10_01315 [Thermoflavifilum sp.]|nr:hypothetical protein [Thermoflavifilum sp.]MCL6513027.1 hypothetical protein [Alicyclobacillus sp.]